MNNTNSVKQALAEFTSVDKFIAYQHLQPAVENSTEEDKKFVNGEMNACCNELLQQIDRKTSSPSKLKKIVRNSLEKVKNAMLDTEDEEFCYELYFKIGEILGIDIEDKTITIEQKLKDDLQRIAKNAGINLDELLSPNSNYDKHT